MSSHELHALIVEHLADLDRAAAGIREIEATVFTAIGDKVEAWAKKQGWAKDFHNPEGVWLGWPAWIAPLEWRPTNTHADDDKFDGRFELGVGGGDTDSGKAGEDRFHLTRLCRAGAGQIGFRFGRPAFVTPKKWKLAVLGLAEITKHTRFVLDEEPSFFLPVTIEAATLAQALRKEDLEAALNSFDAALDSLLQAKPSFDEVLRRLRSADS